MDRVESSMRLQGWLFLAVELHEMTMRRIFFSVISFFNILDYLHAMMMRRTTPRKMAAMVAIQIKPPTACLNSSIEKATTKARMIAS